MAKKYNIKFDFYYLGRTLKNKKIFDQTGGYQTTNCIH